MKHLKLGLVFLLITLVLLTILALPRLINISEIDCGSQYGVCNQRFEARLDELKGKNLYEVKMGVKEILKDESSILSYSTHFVFPDKLKVSVLMKKARYALKKAGTDSYFLVDNKGDVLAVEASNNLPFLETSENPPNVGEKISDTSQFALEIIADMYYIYQVQKGKIENDGLSIELSKGLTVIFPLEGDRERLVSALILIISRLKDENGKSVTTIDLRFKNPVIK